MKIDSHIHALPERSIALLRRDLAYRVTLDGMKWHGGNYPDFEITPKCRLVANANLLWFDEVAVLQTFTFQDQIHRFIGTDISAGVEYRPLLNNNVIINFGVASLLPGRGFHDLYDNIVGPVNPMLAAFIDVGLTY